MKLQKVSNRYIKAFLQVTGIEDQKVKEYENCFMLFERLFAQKIISVFLLSPVTPRENKKVVFTEILHSIEADTYMCNFVYALLDANRLAVLPTLGAAYRGEVERIKKITPVKVVVAVDLQAEDKNKIETLLQQSVQQEMDQTSHQKKECFWKE